MVQYEWNQSSWESLSELEWDANATVAIKDTTTGFSNAIDTLPFDLILQKSANSPISVWTRKEIEKGTKFGPLQGEIIEDNSWKLRTAKRSDVWPIFSPSSSNQISHYIDTSPLFGSNWMRYVAFPGASSPHNLIACQVKSDIYFFARENIPPLTELKVWFHPSFFERVKSSAIHNILWSSVERLPYHHQHHQHHHHYLQQHHHNFLESGKYPVHLHGFPLASALPRRNHLQFLVNAPHEQANLDRTNWSYNKLPKLFHRRQSEICSTTLPNLHALSSLNGLLRTSHDDNNLGSFKSRIHQNVFLLRKTELEEASSTLNLSTDISDRSSCKESSLSSDSNFKHETTASPMSCPASLETTNNSSNYSWTSSDGSFKESAGSSDERGGKKFTGKEGRSLPGSNQEHPKEAKRKGRGVASLPFELPRVNGKTIYECRLCKKVCAQLSNLRVHMYTHTGERPFACLQCPSRFTQKAHLHKHMSTHTGVKPFSCPICGKKSASSSNIKAHMKVHDGR